MSVGIWFACCLWYAITKKKLSAQSSILQYQYLVAVTLLHTFNIFNICFEKNCLIKAKVRSGLLFLRWLYKLLFICCLCFSLSVSLSVLVIGIVCSIIQSICFPHILLYFCNKLNSAFVFIWMRKEEKREKSEYLEDRKKTLPWEVGRWKPTKMKLKRFLK